MKPKFRIRNVSDTDHAYIHHAWWKTVKPFYPFTDGQLLKQAVAYHVDKSIRAGLAENVIACDASDPDTIYSVLMCHQVTDSLVAIDFGYTRNSARRLGFQTALMDTIAGYKNKVITMNAPCFSMREFCDDQGEPLGYHLKNKHGIIIDPFLYERLSLVGYGEK